MFAPEILLQRDRHHFLEVGQPFEHFSDPSCFRFSIPAFAARFRQHVRRRFCCTSFRTGGVITKTRDGHAAAIAVLKHASQPLPRASDNFLRSTFPTRRSGCCRELLLGAP